MIAALPMYDWPEARVRTDKKWQELRACIIDQGFSAPAALTRDRSPYNIWLSEYLLLAQTCAHPLATSLQGQVTYLASANSKVTGCIHGHYRSAIITRKGNAQSDIAPPDHCGALLPSIAPKARFAFNGRDSLSGYVAIERDIDAAGQKMPEHLIETGSHRASIIAVAQGMADYAAIDCVTLEELAQPYEPEMTRVVIVGWTGSRPALPFITRKNAPTAEITALRQALHLVYDAVILEQPTDMF